jgi:L-lactate dehydrogenase complex protein LldG
MPNKDLVKEFTAKAEAVQAVVSEIADFSDAIRYALALTQRQGGKTIVAPGLGDQASDLLKKESDAFGLVLMTSPLRPEANNIHTALTLVDGAIAETGSLVVNSSSEDVRIATMLAESHVAVVPSARIVPDTEALEDQLDKVLKTDEPSYTAFITGASRTADIERVLAIGVHGPQELHILIWGGTPS